MKICKRACETCALGPRSPFSRSTQEQLLDVLHERGTVFTCHWKERAGEASRIEDCVGTGPSCARGVAILKRLATSDTASDEIKAEAARYGDCEVETYGPADVRKILLEAGVEYAELDINSPYGEGELVIFREG